MKKHRHHRLSRTPEAVEDLKRFASALRSRRGTATQTKIATAIGISVTQYSNLECAQNWPSMQVYVALCRHFGVKKLPFFHEHTS
jgi:transcriptional regulator with XRE-family HTH domain